MRRQNLKLLFIGLLIAQGLRATDNAHFYKSANLHRNPTACWFDDKQYYGISDWLWKVEDNLMYGDAHSGWDKNGNTTNILNDTGAYSMVWLFENVQITDPTIQNHANFMKAFTESISYDPDSTFGTLKFDGKFEMWESNYQVRKNLKKGFFLEGRVPVREVKIKNISYTDQSPEHGVYSQETGEWIQFKNDLNSILNYYDYKSYSTPYGKTGLGDISLLLGWEDIFEKRNDEGEDVFTLDLSARLGFLCPTGERVKTDYIFSIPTGYNHHWGLTGSLELDFGVLRWLSIDLFGGFTWFFDENRREMRMQTFSEQNGHIMLAKGMAKEEKGTLWYLGADMKFDHFWKGLSGIFGYSYNRQEEDSITPDNTTLFDKAAVNKNSMLHGWYTHVLHFMLDYDFSIHMKETTKWAPRVNVFYELPIDGKNSYKTDPFGAGIGVDLLW
ncbi:hypothetical protein KJ644_02640 [Candidatus Dependentiae bacterium]|nr:hypothetical protein [Candidatus Dependentiae bacterium]MBU4387346.1 hypothetical protein [Candidatus Dependentiae bacterium]MCG2756189.1 hypothetical protein [Candidatus Dependentiae bacterium]